MSILSDISDGLNFFYGFTPGDFRRIDVREGPHDTLWRAWVGGNRITDAVMAAWASKDEAEAAALSWMKSHPVADETYTAIQSTGRKAS